MKRLAVFSAFLLAALCAAADARIGASRKGGCYYPGESVELRCSADGATVLRVRVSDWLGKEILVKKVPEGEGSVAVSEAELHGLFGAFRAALEGRRADGSEAVLAHGWFARLTRKKVEPVDWAGTGVHGWPADMSYLDHIATAGLGMVRQETGWANSEREKGVYTVPDTFEATLARMKELGIGINFIFNYDNPVAYPEDPFNCEAFCAWAKHFASKYTDIKVFEIWNEGYNFGFRKKYGDDWNYDFVKFCRPVAEALHEVRPDATVEVCAEDGWEALEVQLKAGIAKKNDCVSIHPYIHGADPRPERHYYFFKDGGAAMRRVASENGGASRFRITEMGWTTYSADENGKAEHWFVGGYPGVSYASQAQYIVRAYLIARSNGIECMMQYDFHDDGPRRNYTEHNFGLMFEDYTPKPSFAAVAQMTRLLGEAEPLGETQDDGSKMCVCRFRMPGGSIAYAAWAVEGTVEIDLPKEIAGGGRIVDLMGNARPVAPEETRIALTERPVYMLSE